MSANNESNAANGGNPGDGGYGYSLPPASPDVPPPPPQRPAAVSGADIGGGVKWSWDVFRRSPVPMILPGLLMIVAGIAAVVIGVVGVLWMVGDAEWTTQSRQIGTETETWSQPDSINVGGLILIIAAVIVMVFIFVYLQAGVLAGAIRVADGEVVTSSSFIRPKRLGAVIVAMILMGVAIAIGLVLLIVPGLILIFALQYTLLFVMDRGLSPVAAMKASWRLAFSNVTESILVLLVRYVYSWIGGIFLGVGAIVTLPMSEAFLVHSYRALQQRPVPALT